MQDFIHEFTFNPFSENTFVVSNKDKECVIIDPGMSNRYEQQELVAYLDVHGLVPVSLVNTHCHIDHVLGNAFVFDKWGLKPIMHLDAVQTLLMATRSAEMFGINYDPSPQPTSFLQDGDVFSLGELNFKILLVPGHAPGHIALYLESADLVIAGDVLFQGSVGRTDLPGCDAGQLVKSIQEKMYALPDETVVYCGHGPETTIGREKRSNPFVRPGFSAL